LSVAVSLSFLPDFLFYLEARSREKSWARDVLQALPLICPPFPLLASKLLADKLHQYRRVLFLTSAPRLPRQVPFDVGRRPGSLRLTGRNQSCGSPLLPLAVATARRLAAAMASGCPEYSILEFPIPVVLRTSDRGWSEHPALPSSRFTNSTKVVISAQAFGLHLRSKIIFASGAHSFSLP